MNHDDFARRLDFLRAAEQLKTATRTSWKSDGTRETVAEHTWRLCLMALVFRDSLGDIDFGRLLELLVVHDLGEAIGGDISAVLQSPGAPKSDQERIDLLTLLALLPAQQQAPFVALWDEYEAASTPEARVAKGLDKLETILQHNQGANPEGFDYRFNLTYARRHTDTLPVLQVLREMLDTGTRERMGNEAPERTPEG